MTTPSPGHIVVIGDNIQGGRFLHPKGDIDLSQYHAVCVDDEHAAALVAHVEGLHVALGVIPEPSAPDAMESAT